MRQPARLHRRHYVGAGLLALAVGLAIVFALNAILRPGCSLLPVALPDDDPNGSFHPASPEQACAALGRPVPVATMLPDGVERRGLAIAGAPLLRGPRDVTVSYSKSGRGVALLRVIRADGIPTGNLGDINGTVAGAPAIVRQTRLVSVDADDVLYLWSRDGLLLTLHVRLEPGIAREAADAMAASIR